ncbi:MAG: glycosyltransferase family 2 protein, partial [Oligosphaeraceae bacterium]|nr:glycosyltransferase family 2 protein [Oligosphaeraceae bacterium]
MNYELSIIIPAWQAGKYLAGCLSSILGRMPCPAEVLLVNDASNDDTLQIAQSFAAQYPQELKIIDHPKNLGVAASRNTALCLARGELCMFVDADDQIDSEEFSKLYARQKQHGTDLTCGNFLKIYPQGTTEKLFTKHSGSKLVSRGQHFPGMVPYLPMLDSSCGKLFRTSLLRQHGFRFNSALRYGEDTLFTHAYALAADSLLFCYDCCCYLYYQHESSCMHTINMHTRLQQLDTLLCE